MNLLQWSRPGVPIEILALKLTEEVGEVAKEITDGWKNDRIRRKAIREELDHVIELATILKHRI